jgi:hypothetical protein
MLNARKPPAGWTYATIGQADYDQHRARDAWRRAVAAAAISDDDLREAYAIVSLSRPSATVSSNDALREAGATEYSIELIQQGQPGQLKLSQAVLAARVFDCSLAYLALTTREHGQPPGAARRFNPAAYIRRRTDARISAERVRAAPNLSPRDARRLALGMYEPTVRQLAALEQILRLPPAALLNQ